MDLGLGLGLRLGHSDHDFIDQFKLFKHKFFSPTNLQSPKQNRPIYLAACVNEKNSFKEEKYQILSLTENAFSPDEFKEFSFSL